ncbi:UNKNOWN [Stylonychia lemnae]|uniref:Uncharacterized protein n=1 Tax=Stylonychia lemnae TaxID=5949 RepID=A0A078AIC4_STYLE|nr:UNKNOWN [Stylonychia lemnae]|eukprot:CDW81964.1 UNKNOWN [Stylonychia lemnae]
MKFNSQLELANQRGIISPPDQDIMTQVALINNPTTGQEVGDIDPIILGQPEINQTGFIKYSTDQNIALSMVMHGKPLFPPAHYQDDFDPQQVSENQQLSNAYQLDHKSIYQTNIIQSEHQSNFQEQRICSIPLSTNNLDRESPNSRSLLGIKYQMNQEQPQLANLNIAYNNSDYELKYQRQ